MADAIILLVLVAALYLGLRRGLIAPMISWFSFFIALALVLRFHELLDAYLTAGWKRALGTIAAVFGLTVLINLLATPLVKILRRVPGVGPLDRVAGAVFNVGLAFLLLYIALAAVLDFDARIYPAIQSGVVTARELGDYRAAALASPWLRLLVSDDQLARLQRTTGAQGIPLADMQKVEGFLDFYVKNVRDPLVQSRLAPVINNVGGQVPFLGHPRPYLAQNP